jgi:hypothetical protein
MNLTNSFFLIQWIEFRAVRNHRTGNSWFRRLQGRIVLLGVHPQGPEAR